MIMPMPAAVSALPPMTNTLDSVASDFAESNLDWALSGQTVPRHMLSASDSLPLAIKPTTTPPTNAATPTPPVTKPAVRSGLLLDGAGSGGGAGGGGAAGPAAAAGAAASAVGFSEKSKSCASV